MSGTLKPGEYVGADGQVRMFEIRCNVAYHFRYDPRLCSEGIEVANLRAAAAALVALADELETEVVELGENYRIVTRDGESWLERFGDASQAWRKSEPGATETDDTILAAYRAGQDRGPR